MKNNKQTLYEKLLLIYLVITFIFGFLFIHLENNKINKISDQNSISKSKTSRMSTFSKLSNEYELNTLKNACNTAQTNNFMDSVLYSARSSYIIENNNEDVESIVDSCSSIDNKSINIDDKYSVGDVFNLYGKIKNNLTKYKFTKNKIIDEPIPTLITNFIINDNGPNTGRNSNC